MFVMFILLMLLHSRVQSRNSQVSIETLDFVRVRTSGVIGVGSSAGAQGWWAMPDPIAACGRSHSRWWRVRNIAKRPGGGYGRSATGVAQWPIGRGIAPPTSDAARQLVVVASARRMGAFNGGQRSDLWRSGACVETRARKVTERRGKGGVAIVDRTPGTGDQRPAIAIGRHCGRSVQLMSALMRL